MSETIEEAQEASQRRPYRTKAWWAEYDHRMNAMFKPNTPVKWKAFGGHIVEGRTITEISHGRLRVYNPVTGKDYSILAESLVLPQSKNVEEMRSFLDHLVRFGARSELLSHTRPISTEIGYQPQRIMPLSPDEMISHTVLKAVTKSLERLRTNRDSFRNPKLHDLLHTASSALHECLRELEGYDRYPEDA